METLINEWKISRNMTYLVETERATYIVQTQTIGTPTKSNRTERGSVTPFKKGEIDALIVQTDNLDTLIRNHDCWERQHIDYLAGRAREGNRIPLYGIDVGTRWTGDLASYAHAIPLALLTAADANALWLTPLIIDMSALATRIKPNRFTDIYDLITQNRIFEGPNAIIAEKIEKYIADRVAQERDTKKPTIGIVTQPTHGNIVTHLKSESRRKKTLWWQEHVGPERWTGYDTKTLNRVEEAINNGRSWQDVELLDAGLFRTD